MRIIFFAFFRDNRLRGRLCGDVFNLSGRGLRSWNYPAPGTIRSLSHSFRLLTASAMFWFRALWLEAQKVDHEFCALRFDEGIALFLMGLSISALVRVENTFPARLAIPYFLFAILALGSSKNESALPRRAIPKFAESDSRVGGHRFRAGGDRRHPSGSRPHRAGEAGGGRAERRVAQAAGNNRRFFGLAFQGEAADFRRQKRVGRCRLLPLLSRVWGTNRPSRLS